MHSSATCTGYQVAGNDIQYVHAVGVLSPVEMEVVVAHAVNVAREERRRHKVYVQDVAIAAHTCVAVLA